jgi:hypothetical protein
MNSFNSHLKKFSVVYMVHSDRTNHAYLNTDWRAGRLCAARSSYDFWVNQIGAKKCRVAGCMVMFKNARTPHTHVHIVRTRVGVWRLGGGGEGSGLWGEA